MPKPPRILVVDDEPHIRALLRTTLARAGYAVVEAATAREALNARAIDRPDLVLLDLGLPDRDGLELIAASTPTALVLALGLDASADDPIGALEVTTSGFAEAARAVAGAGYPTAIVQEGGYLCPALPRNLAAFLAGFDGRRT